MLTHVRKQTWIRSAIVSAVCLVLFFIINVITSGNLSETDEQKSVTKNEAIHIASSFIEEQTGATISKVDAVYDSNKSYTGYVDKNKAATEHYKHIDAVYPYEFFTVYAILQDTNVEAKVNINVATGKITGWDIPAGVSLDSSEASEALIKETLKLHNFPTENMTLEKQDNGTFIAKNEQALKATDATIDVRIEASNLNGKPFITSYQPKSYVPSEYTAYTKKQDKLANWYTYAGFTALTVIMGILALIYAILYRRFTSFKYGIIFTAIATIISGIGQITMMKPILILQGGTLNFDQIVLISMNVVILISVIVSAASFYFSFIAGDGLWKAQGFKLWPRFKEKGFGETVWNSMLLGLLFAISGFGIQAVIFEGLSYIIGTHQAIDALQSPMNSSLMWFYPLLAWSAAISEEAVYRYFGVGIFRRWFKHTYAAAIIPSLVWAFGHTMYPLYPVSTRIIELVIIGVLLTWVMVKFGLLTGIFTHAMFNTIAMSLSLFYYGEAFDMVMGIIYIILPVVIAYVIKLIHARYIKNKPEQPPTPPQAEQPTYYYEPQQPNQI